MSCQSGIFESKRFENALAIDIKIFIFARLDLPIWLPFGYVERDVLEIEIPHLRDVNQVGASRESGIVQRQHIQVVELHKPLGMSRDTFDGDVACR